MNAVYLIVMGNDFFVADSFKESIDWVKKLAKKVEASLDLDISYDEGQGDFGYIRCGTYKCIEEDDYIWTGDISINKVMHV